MTHLDLLQSLKGYLEEKTANMQLRANVPKNGTEAAYRAPKVFIGNLPDKQSEKKYAPYILLKFLVGKDDEEESTAKVRIIFVTFSEDKEENYMQCLSLGSRIRTGLLEDVVIAQRYSCQKPLEMVIYDDDLEVYQIGEIMSTWEMPKIERNIRAYLE